MTDTLVKLCGMWQRERRGNTEGQFYLVGRLGAAEILGFKNHRKQSDDDPDWNFFLTEPTPRQGAQESERAPQPSEGRAGSASRSGQLRTAGDAILRDRGRDGGPAGERDPGQHDTETGLPNDDLPF